MSETQYKSHGCILFTDVLEREDDDIEVKSTFDVNELIRRDKLRKELDENLPSTSGYVHKQSYSLGHSLLKADNRLDDSLYNHKQSNASCHASSQKDNQLEDSFYNSLCPEVIIKEDPPASQRLV